jgi:hypothetical protein
MSLKTTGIPFNNRFYTNRSKPSDETAKVFKIAAQIKSIERSTAYIKETGQAPPSTPNYYLRKLDSF